MRMLDNYGFRTGYIYRQPLLRASTNRTNINLNDIEIPPAAQNHLSSIDGDGLLLDNWLTPLRSLINSSIQQKKEKMNWINTPNSYQKVELSETGTEDPKKITKWVNGDATNGGSQQNIKIDSSHQFVPINENNRREFHEKQKKMKEYRRANQISEGPQSRILEASFDSVDSDNQQRYVIGAASKGIIQKEYQQNAKIYKTLYEKNPFDKVDQNELDEYTNSIVGNKSSNRKEEERFDDSYEDQSDLVRHIPSEQDRKKGNKAVHRSNSHRMAAAGSFIVLLIIL